MQRPAHPQFSSLIHHPPQTSCNAFPFPHPDKKIAISVIHKKKPAPRSRAPKKFRDLARFLATLFPFPTPPPTIPIHGPTTVYPSQPTPLEMIAKKRKREKKGKTRRNVAPSIDISTE